MVSKDGSNRQCSPAAFEPQNAILAGYVAFNCNFIPTLRVADIVDRDVVVLAPKERNGGKFLTMSHHIECSGSSLTLRHDPVFDSNVCSRVRIRPARNVTSGKYTLRTRLEIGIHDDAALDGNPGLYGKFNSWDETPIPATTKSPSRTPPPFKII